MIIYKIENILQKKCSKCKLKRPLTEFSHDGKSNDGLSYWCKECVKENQQTPSGKVIKKKSDQRYYQRHKEMFAARSERYRQDHKEEITAINKAYYQANKLKCIERMKDYRESHKAETAERGRAYSKTPNGIATRKKSEHKYRQTPKGKARNVKHSHNHRALKLNATIEDFNPVEVFKRDGYQCQLCGKKTRPNFKNSHHPLYPNLDHIIPLSKGGEHSKRNTQCLCRQCNTTKNNTGVGDQLRMFG